LVGDPVMMEHLGGPESEEKILDRQRRYEAPGTDSFKVVDLASGEGAGWVGFWSSEWDGEEAYEVGWSILPAFQGRGLAGAAAAAVVGLAAADGRHEAVFAFPAPANEASNAICRRLGFVLLGEADAEYPPGQMGRWNVWRLELGAGS
jgi:RimJ/RimL family protein N-acetyltransferase